MNERGWDDSWDMCCGVPVYNFCTINYFCDRFNADGKEWPTEDCVLIAIGEKAMCLTPPVIPQPDEDPHKLVPRK